jgi:hypothetical protein
MGMKEPLRIQEPVCAEKSELLRYPKLPGYLVQPEVRVFLQRFDYLRLDFLSRYIVEWMSP